ncbi:acyltransferase family protein, partial [Neobacillus niacini]|uniref:acyltransferase family protein n=1 Tax=Neobacillus niacini TaxID=86668 RepID=UPI002FFFCDC8
MYKRFCRIYIPYIVSILISGLLFIYLNDKNAHSFSDWFNNMWSDPITIKTVLDYTLMLSYDTHNLNTVTWSLVHEMRISLFFPFLLIPIIKYDWKKSLPLCMFITLSLWVITLNISLLISNEFLFRFIYSYSYTFYYSSFFVIGAVFGKYYNTIKSLYKRADIKVKSFLALVSILLYSCEWALPGLGKLKYSTLENPLNINIFNTLIDFLIALSVLMLFTISLSSHRFQIVLKNHLLLFLGKISYSLY